MRRGKLTYISVFIFLLCITLPRTADAQEEVHRVLFVGNSYTYFNSMPQLFAAMAEHTMPGHTIETKFLGGGGATMKQHWDVGLVVEELKSSKWDYVVLQGQSMLGSDDLTDPDSPNQFYKYAELLDKEITASGAKTVFYMTWSRKHLPEQQKYLTKAYTHMAEKLGSVLAPVGLVWDRVRGDSSVELYQEDGSHPSIEGSYLAAMTVYASIFSTPQAEMPGVLSGFEILRGGKLSDKKTQLSDLSKAEVQIIQEAVLQVVE